MGESKVWPALHLKSSAIDLDLPDLLWSTLDEFAPVAVQDLAEQPLPPGGLWDPTFPPPPDPPPAPLDWRVFFANRRDRDLAATALRGSHPTLSVSEDDVPDEDWAARSQREVTSIRAGRFVVAPPWDLPSKLVEGATLIVIEPSRGFGTGHHASTRLCLRGLSDIDVRGRRALDLGTGSGVLAMAAAFRGARQVVAIDVDPDAIEAAQSSLALNAGTWPVEWLVGDYRTGGLAHAKEPWDVVVANLTGGMLTSSAARIRELLASPGHLIVSGFDERERAGVESALALQPVATFVEDGWVGLVLST